MSSTMKQITDHYRSAISGEMMKINVPEWDMDIYCRKTYPFKDEARVVELQSKGKTVEALVESLIIKALNKDGKRIFVDLDKTSLRHEADPAVITKVASAINNFEARVDLETLAKE